MNKKIDRQLLISVIILVSAGFFIFTSASLGLLAKQGSKFITIATNQLLFGIALGSIACIITSKINFKLWRKFALPFFIFATILTALVFVPGIGWKHGGASRWIEIFGINFQPSEIIKICYLFLLAGIFAKNKNRITEFKYGLLPYLIVTGIVGAIILNQPDNDTFFMLSLAGFSMLFVSGIKIRDIIILGIIGIIGVGAIVATRPYVLNRIMTFINPEQNSLTSGYQIQQSLIAIGSGGIFGKGFGQSTQKFSFLPEPIGDSIFAVAGEEFGLVGSILIIIMFVFFITRGLKIASKVQDDFGRLLSIGIVILIGAGSFINIAAMLGIIPLSGTPLIFVSHGGTALFIALAEVGILFNISKQVKKV